MRFYFVTNDKWYSKLHRLIAGEKSTHIGLIFFYCDLNIVVDCTKPYGKVYHLSTWLHKYRKISILELPLNSHIEKFFYKKIVSENVNVHYDFKAYYYAWIMAIRKFLFKIPYPKKNKWKTDGKLCVEILEPIKKYLTDFDIDLMDIDLAAISPEMLFNILKDKKNIRVIE